MSFLLPTWEVRDEELNSKSILLETSVEDFGQLSHHGLTFLMSCQEMEMGLEELTASSRPEIRELKGVARNEEEHPENQTFGMNQSHKHNSSFEA